MTYYPVQSPYPIFNDEDGTPLEDGYIYIGEAYQNPITNPITTNWDTSGLYPVAQPIRTIGGYPDRNGSPGIVYVNAGAFEDYSILVQDKHGNQIYFEQSARSAMGGYSGNSLDIISDLRAISGYDQPIYVRGHTTIGDGGQGTFEWINGAAPGTYTDDNGIIIVPTDGDGSGAWIRQYNGMIMSGWYHIVGDGATDNSAAIQNAVDSIYEMGGGTLFFESGQYKFRGIIPKDNIWYECHSDASFIPKIDINDPIFYGFFVGNNTSFTQNVRFLKCNFDFQGDLYPADNGSPSTPLERGINVRSAIDWEFNQCDFYNNPGRQSIWLSDTSNPPNIENIRILNCTFRKFGKDVTGNVYQTDHSCIFVQAKGIIVENNAFFNDLVDTVSTGAELHGYNIVCSGNRIRNVHNGIIISAIYSNTYNVDVVGNSLDNCRLGITLWQGQSFIPYDINFSNNIITNYTFHAISTFQSNASTTFGQLGGFSYGEGISIIGNNIRSGTDVVDNSAYLGSAIRLHYLKNLVINSNIFSRVNGRGIIINSLGGSETDIFIANNKFYLNVAATSASYKNGFQIGDGVSTITNLNILNNFVSDSFNTGIYCDKIAYLTIENNSIYAVTTAIAIDHRTNTNLIKHIGDMKGVDYSSYSNIAIGTSMHDTSTNQRWIRKKTVSPYPINRETWLDAAPVSGTWIYGDISWDTDAGPGTQIGYICTSGGTPGTWKAFGAIAP